MKKAHFSIDDVGASFRYIYTQMPDSIFDLRLFSRLRDWHERYGLIANLYCILVIDGFNISRIPVKYKDEFENNSDWLRFGFHSRNEHPYEEDSDYITSFEIMQEVIENMGMGKTDVIRVHSWVATDEQEKYLKSKGIVALLSPNREDFFYNEKGIYIKNGMVHRRTDYWIERMDYIDESTLDVERDSITLFTHEWCFDKQKNKIENALKVLVSNGFIFI